MTSWLEDHVREIADALFARLFREGIYRRYQLMYFPSHPGARGGLAAIPVDEDLVGHGWQPAASNLDKACSMTCDQIRADIRHAARQLPILDPAEPY